MSDDTRKRQDAPGSGDSEAETEAEAQSADEARSEANAAAAAAEAARMQGEPANDAGDGDADDDPVAALQAQVNDLQEKLKRAVAEQENVRRRAQREKEETGKYAVRKFAGDLLAVADNLRRAIESVDSQTRQDNEAVDQLLTGVEMTEKNLLDAFDKHGVQKILPLGEKFDPNFHEAVFEVPNSGYPNGHVAQVLQPGYIIHDRVLRAAMVGVAKDKPQGVDTSA